MNNIYKSHPVNPIETYEIVIIEDDEGLNHLIYKNLKREGYTCVQAFNGTQAIDAVKNKKNQILILDYKLPDFNGEEIIKSLKEKHDSIPPFIVMTGFGDEKIAVEMMKLGAKQYMVKEGDFINILAEQLKLVVDDMIQQKELKTTKAQLETSKQDFKVLFETMVEGVVYQNSKGEIIAANPAAEQILGLTLDQMTGVTSMDPRWKAVDENYNELPGEKHPAMVSLKTGKRVENFLEGIFNPQKNDYVWILVNSVPQFKKGESTPYQVYVTFTDITERKHAEKELQKSEEKLRTIFENAALGIFRSTSEGRYEEVNLAFARILGFDSPKEMIAEVKNISKLYKHPEDREKIKKEFAEKGFVENYEILANHPHKEVVWISINAKQTQNRDGKIYYEGTVQDITEKKIAEEKLSETEQRLHILADNIPDEIFIKDDQHRFVYVNPKKAKLERITPETMVGKTDFDFFSKPVAQKSYQDDVQILKSGKPIINKEELLINSDGDSRWVLVTKLPRIDKDGKIIGTMGISRDITKRKIAELKLRENEKRLELRKNIAEAFVLEEKDKIFHPVLHTLLGHFNSRFGFFGYIDPKGDLVCPSMTYDIWNECEVKNKSTVFPKEIWTGLWGESLSKQKSLIKNAKLKVPPGHVSLKNAMVGVIKFQGKLIGQLAFANNDKNYTNSDLEELDEICQYISPLLHAELSEEQHTKELIEAKEIAEENERKLIEAQEISHVGSWEYMVDTDVVTWSKELHNIFERPYDLPAPKYAEQAPFYTEESFAKLNKALQDCIRHEIPFEIELDIITASGAVKQIISKGDVKKDANNKVIGSYGTAQDITAQKKLESELIAAKEKAEESDRLKSAFLANMSHEIRTPMNGILGFTDLLKQPDLTGEEKIEFIDVIQKSGDRLLNTVTDLVDISKIEAGLVEVTKSELDANDELKSLYSFFTPEAEQKGLKLSLEHLLPEHSKIILTDITKIQSILTNLIKNAIKYTQKGSIKMGCRLKDNQLVFYVKDTGIGIPKDRQQAVFGRFVQADIADTRVFEGSGLGLSIVKAYAEMLDGNISLESEEGVGSTFYFSLPGNGVNKTAPEKPKIEKQKRPESKKKFLPKILVAEDDEVSFEHLALVLEKHASEIIHATNGEEVVQLCKQQPDIDVVLMDIKMPLLNGYEATQRIREFNKNVIIIAQTAYAMVGDRAATIEAGCNDYIAKPINKDRLLEKIRSHLNTE